MEEQFLVLPTSIYGHASGYFYAVKMPVLSVYLRVLLILTFKNYQYPVPLVVVLKKASPGSQAMS